MVSQVVDSHAHVVSQDRDRYPVNPGSFAGVWWRGAGIDVDGLLSRLDAAGVDAAVVVQPVGVYGYDCRYALEVVGSHRDRLRLVVAVDLSGPDPAAQLVELCHTGLVDGVRLFGVGGADDRWLTDGRGAEMWRTAARLGVPLVPTVLPAALPHLRPLVASYPEVPVVVDHCGFPDLAGGPPFARAAQLWALAGTAPVYLKVTTHVLLEAERHGDPADLVDALAAAFGSERLCWGSDHPQTTGRDYDQKLALARRAARRLGAGSEALFGGTAMRLGWGGTVTRERLHPQGGSGG